MYGYREEYIGRGQSVTINGQTFVSPVKGLHSGTVREVSIVALGADPAAKAKLMDGRGPRLDARAIYARHNSPDKFER